MKLPKALVNQEIQTVKKGTLVACGQRQSKEGRGYRIHICTANLGASSQESGHSFLKHCYAKIENPQGEIIRTLSYGRHGVGSESYPELQSTHCEIQADHLSAQEADLFISEYERYGAQPYRWGSNDCCSLLVKTAQSALKRSPHHHIRKAAQDLRNSPEVKL